MRTLVTALLVATLGVASGGAQRQTFTFQTVEFQVPDPIQAAAWYVEQLGGVKDAASGAVMFGKTAFVFVRNPNPKPSPRGALDHIGFAFRDLDASLKKLQAAGVKIVTPLTDFRGISKYAFIDDPWGTRLELVQEGTPGVIGFHHVHLRLPDGDAGLKWFADHFGGEPAKLAQTFEAIRYGDVLIAAAKGEPEPREGRVLRSIGWSAPSLETAVAELKAKGVVLSTADPSSTSARGRMNYAWFDAPGGMLISVGGMAPNGR